jgi:hypothetical protein
VIQKVVGGTIVEWPVDAGVAKINSGLSRWGVLMLRDGTTEEVWRQEVSGYNLIDGHNIWRRSEAPAYKGKGVPDCLNASVWARNEKHAVKIANEIRTKMIAEGEWP